MTSFSVLNVWASFKRKRHGRTRYRPRSPVCNNSNLWFIWCLLVRRSSKSPNAKPERERHFEGPCSLCLSSLSLVFSWILWLPSVVLASECVLHPFFWHDLAIVIFLGSPSREVFVLFFSLSPHLWLSLQVIPRMPLSHLWWAASSFLLNVAVRGHSSAL